MVGISPVTGGRPAGVVPAAVAVASVGGKLFSPAGGGMPKNTVHFCRIFFFGLCTKLTSFTSGDENNCYNKSLS